MLGVVVFRCGRCEFCDFVAMLLGSNSACLWFVFLRGGLRVYLVGLYLLTSLRFFGRVCWGRCLISLDCYLLSRAAWIWYLWFDFDFRGLIDVWSVWVLGFACYCVIPSCV